MRILAVAYACEPTEGSESGAGWMWSRLLARFGDTTVITRRNNRDLVDPALPAVTEAQNLKFEYVDLPAWARFWKRGQQGVRVYYVLWQLAALRRARRLQRRDGFDLVWHVTLANYWLGSVGGLVGPPFVFGPVGGGVRSCFNVRIVGMKGLVYEFMRVIARAANRFGNPLVRIAWKRASLILVNNPDTRDRMPRRYRAKAVIFPHVLLESVHAPGSQRRVESQTALFAGRLLAWKGVALAIRAIAQLPDWRLIICGRGPDESRLRRLTRRLAIEDRVEFRGWVPRDELQALTQRQASIFLFPSVHDDAPWAVGEAATNEVPVVCLDRGGAAAVAHTVGVPLRGLSHTVRALARAIVEPPTPRNAPTWDLDSRQRELASLLNERGHLQRSVRRGSVRDRYQPR